MAVKRSPLERVGVSAEVLQGLRHGQKGAQPCLSITEKLRIAEYRRFVFDEELESLEKELRRDLFWRGSRLSYDTIRLQQDMRLQLPHLEPEERLHLTACERLGRPHPGVDYQSEQETTMSLPAGQHPEGVLPQTPTTSLAIATADAALLAAKEKSAEEEVADASLLGNEPWAAPYVTDSDQQSWNVLSEEPWVLGDEQCTLIVMEKDAQALIRFDVKKISTGETLQAVGTRAEFQQLCEEQTGLVGSAQVKAAISQLFHGSETCNSSAAASQDVDVKDPINRRGSAIADTSRRMTSQESYGGVRWHLGRQQEISLAGTTCTATILENPTDDLLQFEVLHPGDGGALVASTTNDEFERLCRELGAELTGSARIAAAIEHLFQRDSQNS